MKAREKFSSLGDRLVKLVAITTGLALLVTGAHAETILHQSTPLDAGYRQMYNLQFDDAHRSFHAWEGAHPDDPLGPVSDAAAYLFSEFARLHILEAEFFENDDKFTGRQKLTPDSASKQGFTAALAKSQELADRVLTRAPDDRNAMFSTVLRLGLHSDYLAMVEKKNLAALSDVKNARLLAEKLIAEDPDYSDAYLAVGVENYLLSLKSAPVRWFLHITGAQTDKDEGIEKLNLTAERGHYLQPFARVLLAVAALRDKNTARAKQLLDELSKDFPRNGLYAEQAARLR